MASEVLSEAFSTWKILDDLVDSLLLKPGAIDKMALQTLANMIMSKAFSRTIIYTKEPGITFKEYEDIVDQYALVTTWLLGRFFYLLICEDDEIIVDVQLSILNQLSSTQLHVYDELAIEYCKAFDILCAYLKANTKTMEINVFQLKENEQLKTKLKLKGACIEINSREMGLSLIKKILKILKFVLHESISFNSTDYSTFSLLENLLYILACGLFECEIFDIFISILKRLDYNSQCWHFQIILKIQASFSLYEQFVYEFYNNKNPKNINKLIFENLLFEYIRICGNLKTDIGQHNERIMMFLIKYCIQCNTLGNIQIIMPPKTVLALTTKYYSETISDITNIVRNNITTVISQNDSVMFSLLKPHIFKELFDYFETNSQKTSLDGFEVSETWKLFCECLNCNWNEIQCTNNVCQMQSQIEFLINIFKDLLDIIFKLNRHYKSNELSVYFFNGINIMPTLLYHVAKHYNSCKDLINTLPILQLFVTHLTLADCKNIDIFFHLIACPLLLQFKKPSTVMSNNYIGNVEDRQQLKNSISSLYDFIGTDRRLKNADILKVVNEFFDWISSGFIKNFNRSQSDQIESLHLTILKELRSSEDASILSEVIENIPKVLQIFSDKDSVLNNILLPLLITKNTIVQQSISKVIPIILCTTFSDFTKIITTEAIQIICNKCNMKLKNVEQNLNYVEILFSNIKIDITNVTILFLKTIINYLISQKENVKLAALESMPSFTQHVSKFYTPDVTKIWIELAGDDRTSIRRGLASVIRQTISNGQNNPDIPEDIKNQVLEIIFTALMRLSKKSLKFSECELQDTLLDTVDEIGQIENNQIKLECIKIMIYFIMVPMSYYSFIAVNRCCNLSVKDEAGLLMVYRSNSEIICELVAHLCYINQDLIDASLKQSVDMISVVLGFDGGKEFVTKEAKKLLPYLVAKSVKCPKVSQLIEEIATIMGMELSELLTSNYGHVFLHLFLGNMEQIDIKKCLTYMETKTNRKGLILRKMNIRVILNQLLLNFHEKREQVLTAFQMLLEENNTQATSIEDYLQPYFLPFLLYFDLELTSDYSKKAKILLSLADVLTFLGPNRITPLRFKIINMLQTSHYLKYPELTCQVWDAFIHSCEIDCLGPHLATIFTSMLPLIASCPGHVNRIFQYLIVHNENSLKEYITDLFFVNNSHLASNVLVVIKKYLKATENLTFKEKIQRYLKYLKHDTLEVQIQSLRQLKIYLEQNREELDEMILGYNGIDNTIVELIDYLTLGCREVDITLKLACGELFGELGAIEPSHLPRRYAHNNQSFIFFINDDAFIEGALNELIKAFQTDKNARNTDRVALAIQEILKTYEISPDKDSQRNLMWSKFPESHREVMTPLLSSKYICVENFNGYPCPLFGSSDGPSFQAWLHNWTSSLISTFPVDEQTLLQSCFPSMKLDKRVLMHFLPYILLHTLLKDFSDEEGKGYTEFKAVLNSFHSKRPIDDKILNTRPLLKPGKTPTASEVIAEEDKQIECTKVVFILLDFLDRWLREWQWLKGTSAGTDINYKAIQRFLTKFCKLELAKCNYKCGEYPRALMYLEYYITENPDQISANLQFLGEIYAQLDEPDGVLGLEPLQQGEPSLEQKLLSLEVSGKLNDAAAIYEHMPTPLKLQHIKGLLQCYLDLDKVNSALYCAEGALKLQPQMENMFSEIQAEALWRLGSYDELENLLNKPDIDQNRGWGIQVGKTLVCIKQGERDEFKKVLQSIKRQLVDCFGAATLEEGAYQHGYSYIAHLHCLNELEQLEKALFDLFIKPNDQNYAESVINKLAKEWQLRIKVVQESVRVVEPLLCVRRVALNLGRIVAEKKAPLALPYFNKLLGETWQQSVKAARNAGVHQQAYTYVLDAEKYNPPTLFIEKAKLHWLREEHKDALITLKRGLNVFISENLKTPESQEAIARLSLEQKKICAEAKLLIATYNNDICSVDVETNLMQYKEAVEVFKEWEKSNVCLAQYQDRIFQNYSDAEKDSKGSELQLHIMHNFGKSLYYGTTYIYQSMPRLLSIWFDYSTRLLDVTNNTLKEERQLILVKMTKIIDSFLNKLPAFVFLTSFSQIISRIAHPQKEVYGQIKKIIIKLMQHYPQQCLWMISSVIKSSYPIRAKRCAEILTDPRLKSQTSLVRDFTSLAEKLIELCNKEIPADVNSTTVSLLVRALPRMLNKHDFSEIMMPTHKFRKLILPNPDFKNTQHNPFPNYYVHIVGIDDNISVLTSLQRPRKIGLRGSDGKSYTFMLKPKDDLRKDFRLMEFNDIVNHLLLRDAEARQRRLNIRLYSVAPLNEECGLIEWVNDLVGLRPVLMNIYKQKGLGMRPREIKEVCCSLRDPLVKKKEIFNNVLLKMHPPVLGEWFRKTFPDAQTWLTARTGYIRTTAVISITGYMLGLGDRHGENILLDSTCGDVVHVDFNCLFNKGESFEWPERVPFRLTQNMIAAMGPLGVEGVFKKACEFTLRVLRTNTATLMSIVTPFVYDPLVSWPRNNPSVTHNSERVNEQAFEYIKNIEFRLQGKVKTKSRTMSQCLSIEGQVNYLINEAKSVDNLCQMYIGWGPYL